MIRQAISCDVCASEKKQTNHWFVASDQGGELRLSAYNSRSRTRPGAKHLCGLICLHKLVEEFMTRAIDGQVQASCAEGVADHATVSTQVAASRGGPAMSAADGGREEVNDELEGEWEEPEAADLKPPLPRLREPRPIFTNHLPFRPLTEPIAMPARQPIAASAASNDAAPYTLHTWRVEAWDRERERELRAVGRRSEGAAHRRSGP